jgi:hypothetical protein
MKKTLLLLACLWANFAVAQGLEFDEDEKKEAVPVEHAFNGMRVVNGQSVDVMGKGTLDFVFIHRFGAIADGAFNLWGLDQGAAVRLGLEYGITKNFTAGFGRTSAGKNYDGFLKYRFLTQSSGAKTIPVTLVWFSSMAFSARNYRDNKATQSFFDQQNYTHQMLIGRKFSSRWSAQLSPTVVHRNLVASADIPNTLIATGIGTKIKLTKAIYFTADYFHVFNNPSESKNGGLKLHNPLAIGLDMVTGGHVFHLYFANSEGMIEKEFIGNTLGDWRDKGMRFGFSISRSFSVAPEVKGGSVK